jgi:hypothetical protein
MPFIRIASIKVLDVVSLPSCRGKEKLTKRRKEETH